MHRGNRRKGMSRRARPSPEGEGPDLLRSPPWALFTAEGDPTSLDPAPCLPRTPRGRSSIRVSSAALLAGSTSRTRDRSDWSVAADLLRSGVFPLVRVAPYATVGRGNGRAV